MVRYEGERCRLRPLRRDDIRKTLEWRNNPAIRDRNFGARFPVTEVMEEAWFADALADTSNRRIIFAVEDAGVGELIGMVYLHSIDWVGRTAMFTIMIGDEAYHGHGFGTEATALALEIAFQHFNLRKLTLIVGADNAPARKVYEKLGFTEEGRLKDHVYYDGAFQDVHYLSKFREDGES
ncbi:MAG: GNAT family protein [Rhodospirillales bacterium]|jgi:RimJ/RimL family protein N-acetyltransferase|nr:GNAT family protein [Rhodospirillales bacterium]